MDEQVVSAVGQPVDYTVIGEQFRFAGVVGDRARPEGLDRIVAGQPGHHLIGDRWRDDPATVVVVDFEGRQMNNICLAAARAYPPVVVPGFEYSPVGRWATGVMIYVVPLYVAQLIRSCGDSGETVTVPHNGPVPAGGCELEVAVRLWRATGDPDEDVARMLEQMSAVLFEAKLSGLPVRQVLDTALALWADRDDDPEQFDDVVEAAAALLAH